MKNIITLILTFFCVLQLFSQKTDSLQKNRRLEFKPAQLIAPAALIGSGTVFLLTSDRDVKYYGKKYGFGSYPEDFLQGANLAAGVTFGLLGMKSRTDLVNSVAIGLKVSAINFGATTAIKYLTKKNRPDGTGNRGFPSGHTANAFASATSLTTEFGENYPWVPYAAYTVATGVGALRAIHNKHYISDVLVGAGIGILSSKIAYWTHQYKWKTKEKEDPFSGVIYDKKSEE